MVVKNISKSGLRAVKMHQFLSFSRGFAKCQGASSVVFFPGCALIGESPQLTLEVYGYLKTVYPNLGLSSFCCGYPAKSLVKQGLTNDKKAKIYDAKLEQSLKGIQTVITACPNCTATLKANPKLQVVSVWEVLAEHFPQEQAGKFANYQGDLREILENMAIHDPCPTLHQPQIQQAFRDVMSKLGVHWQEFEATKEKTICCGRKNMAIPLRPEAGRAVTKMRLAQSPAPNILTYCYACVHAFNGLGGRSFHGLELVFLPKPNLESAHKSWKNRHDFANRLFK